MKALLFGSIGTVCSTSEIQLQGYNAAFAYAGLDWFWDTPTYKRLLGVTGGKARLRQYATEVEAPSVDDALLDQIHEYKTQHYQETMRPGAVGLRPGVRRLINSVKASEVKLAFVTTTERRNLETIDYALEDNFTLSDFDVVMDRDMVEAEKPAPEVYRRVLDALDIHAADAVAIEDTSECVASAVAAQIRCIATPHRYSLDQDFSKAVACLDHLGDPGNPATLIFGRQVTNAGIVTVDSLRTGVDR